MPVTDVQAAALRAFLTQDIESAARLTRNLSREETSGYTYLALAALSVAARDRFHPECTHADMVRYVAKARIQRIQDGEEYDFDPAAAENVLRHALGHPVTHAADPQEQFRAVIALLSALAGDAHADQAEVDMVLARARVLADRWMAG